MDKKCSYSITLSKTTSEKEAIQLLINSDMNFINPDKASRKLFWIYSVLKRDFIEYLT